MSHLHGGEDCSCGRLSSRLADVLRDHLHELEAVEGEFLLVYTVADPVRCVDSIDTLLAALRALPGPYTVARVAGTHGSTVYAVGGTEDEAVNRLIVALGMSS